MVTEYNMKKKEYNKKYNQEHFKQLNIRIPKDEYDIIVAYVDFMHCQSIDTDNHLEYSFKGSKSVARFILSLVEREMTNFPAYQAYANKKDNAHL